MRVFGNVVILVAVLMKLYSDSFLFGTSPVIRVPYRVSSFRVQQNKCRWVKNTMVYIECNSCKGLAMR